MSNVAAHPVRCISLCAGGGGLDLAVRSVIRGARTVLYVERDIPAVALLAARIADGALDDALVWDDIRTVDCGPLRGCVDVVFGGIPCQPHSYAGKRLGAADPRDLWPDAFRIIRDTRCHLAFIENVGGSLREYHRVWRRDLESIGFRVKEIIVSAADVGGTHGRPRLFILAVADANGSGRRAQGHPNDQASGPDRSGRTAVADRDGGGLAAVAGAACKRPDADDGDAPMGDTEHGAGGTEHAQQSADGLPLAGDAGGGVSGMGDATVDGHERSRGAWGGRSGSADADPLLVDTDGARWAASGRGGHDDERGEPRPGRPDDGSGVGLADSGRERPQGLGAYRPAAGTTGRGGRAGVDWRYAPPGNSYDKHGRLIDERALEEWQRVLAVRPDLAPAIIEAEAQSPFRSLAHDASRRVGIAGADLTRAMKLHILGNGVVPPQAAIALRMLMEEMGVQL